MAESTTFNRRTPNYLEKDNSTAFVPTADYNPATKKYVDDTSLSVATVAVADVIAAAPTTLDTLNELAAALGDDPNFATTMTNALAGKLSLTGGSLTGNLSLTGANPHLRFAPSGANDFAGIRFNYTSNDGVMEFWTSDDYTEPFVFRAYDVGSDGTGTYQEWMKIQSGNIYENGTALSSKYLGISAKAADSELIDGIDSSRIIYGSNENKTTNVSNVNTALPSGIYDGSSATGSPTATWYTYLNMRHNNTVNNYGGQLAMSFYDTQNVYVRNINNGSYGAWAKLWNSSNDGAGSGLDADLLDSLHASSLLRSDADDSFTGTLSYSGSDDEALSLVSSTYTTKSLKIGGWTTTNTAGVARIRMSGNLHIDSPSDGNLYLNHYTNQNTYISSGGGNVGIGLTNPGVKLDVNGDIKARGNIFNHGNLYLNYDQTDATDSYIYFGDGESATASYLKFDDGNQRHEFSNNIWAPGYVYSGGDLLSQDDIYINYNAGAEDSSLFFGDDAGTEAHHITLDYSEQEFAITDSINVEANVKADEYQMKDATEIVQASMKYDSTSKSIKFVFA